MKMLREGVKRIVLFALAVAVTISATTPEKAEALPPMAVYTGESHYDAFQYDTSVYNVAWMQEYVNIPVWCDSDAVCIDAIGVYCFVCGIAREKRTDNYTLLVRQIMQPSSGAVLVFAPDYGAFNGYGISEYCSFSVKLPTLDDFAPKNTPKKGSVTVEWNATTNINKLIKLDYNIKDDVDVSVECNVPKHIYSMSYDYQPHVINPFENNSYFRKTSDQNSMARFHMPQKQLTLTVNYDARFGVSHTKGANALQIEKFLIIDKQGTLVLCFPAIQKD